MGGSLEKIWECLLTIEVTAVDYSHDRKEISEVLSETKAGIADNFKKLESNEEMVQVSMLRHFLRDLLMRAMRGDAGARIDEKLKHSVTTLDFYSDSKAKAKFMKEFENGYRFGNKTALDVCSNASEYLQGVGGLFKYVNTAKAEKKTNFSNDGLLKIKYIGMKVRDLALSNFCDDFVAFDLHVPRVITRLGLFDSDDKYTIVAKGMELYEIGNNPANKAQYLFMHQFILKMAEELKKSPSEIDRAFWHLGKEICGSKPKCCNCKLIGNCALGKAWENSNH